MSGHSPIDQTLADNFVGAAHGDFETVKSMLEQYPELVNRNASWNELPIEAAAQTGRCDIALLLLDYGATLDICTAAMLGWDQEVQKMLAADPSQITATGAHGIPLLYFPAISGDIEMAAYLLEKGAEVNAGDGSSSPLHGAVAFNQPDMVAWLLDHGADPSVKNYDGKTPVELASEQVNQALLVFFSEKGVKP